MKPGPSLTHVKSLAARLSVPGLPCVSGKVLQRLTRRPIMEKGRKGKSLTYYSSPEQVEPEDGPGEPELHYVLAYQCKEGSGQEQIEFFRTRENRGLLVEREPGEDPAAFALRAEEELRELYPEVTVALIPSPAVAAEVDF